MLDEKQLEALKRETHAQEFVRYCETDKDLIDCIIDHLASRLLPDGYVAVPYQPELGTATQAIEFAITIDDHYDRLNFLECWQVGDLSEWDDYKAMIAAAKGE